MDVGHDRADTIRWYLEGLGTSYEHAADAVVRFVHGVGEWRMHSANPVVERLAARDNSVMDVIAHDRVGQALPVRASQAATQKRQVRFPFVLSRDEPIAVDESRDEMIDGAGSDGAWFSRHASVNTSAV